jgi:methionine--tRNA ligase beta chain
MTTFEDFQKLDIRVGTIMSAERVEGSKKLLRLVVDLGEGSARQIVAGIAEHVAPEDLAGRQCPFVANLESRTIMGLESEGMLLAIGLEDGLALLHPSRDVQDGSAIR